MKALTYLLAALMVVAIQAQGASVLCVGLNEYSSYKPLKHAENDAAQMAETLRQQGHDVVLLTGKDVTKDKVLEALKAQPGVVYFAGHAQKGILILADGPLALKDVAAQTALMLLDCCYVGRGLQEAGATRVYAAAEFEAFESGGHGLFTKYLLKWLADGKSFQDNGMLDFVGRGIGKETGGWQKPALGFI